MQPEQSTMWSSWMPIIASSEHLYIYVAQRDSIPNWVQDWNCPDWSWLFIPFVPRNSDFGFQLVVGLSRPNSRRSAFILLYYKTKLLGFQIVWQHTSDSFLLRTIDKLNGQASSASIFYHADFNCFGSNHVIVSPCQFSPKSSRK